MRLKKKVKRLIIGIGILIVIALGVGTYFFLSNREQVSKVKVLKEIKGYGYKLKDNKSKAYKELFEKLEKELSKKEVNEEKYVKLITQMFILDFYSLNEKVAKTDVGGTDFIYPDILENFLDNAEDTIYKYVESDIYNQRKQRLPEVKEITVDQVENDLFEYGDQTDENAYIVEASWNYKNEQDAKGYQDEATLVFIHNGKRLDLVQLEK